MWINAKKKLPEKSGRYLVYAGIGYHSVLDYSAKDQLFNAHDDLDTEWNRAHAIPVTHWMPLPEPPKTGKWVQCKECIYFEDCETKEDRDGCYLGDTEDK